MRHTFRLLLLLVLVAGCASTTTVKTIEATGESTAALENTFATTATAITNGCIAGVQPYTKALCASFRTFGLKFQASVPLVNGLWKAAAAAEDKTLAANATTIFNQLSGELAAFTTAILGGK